MANIINLLEDKLALNELWENSIDENTGEIKECEALEALTKEIEQDLSSKTGRIIQVFQNNKAQIEVLDKEIKRLEARKKSLENKDKNFKNFLKYTLERIGVKKIDTIFGIIGIKNNPASVELIDKDKIPAEFKTIKYVEDISKTEISKALKSGVEVPGAELKQSTSLYIK